MYTFGPQFVSTSALMLVVSDISFAMVIFNPLFPTGLDSR